MTAVEASLRLDAVASGGFGLSRSKMVSLVEGGDVMVDWSAVKNPAHNVQVIYSTSTASFTYKNLCADSFYFRN
jgi:RNA-binding protein YlmH